MENIKKVLKVLFMARISLVITIIMFVLLLKVPQAKDAIIALGNFANFFQYLFFSIIGLLWALSNWYWPRTFYYMEYHKEVGLSKLEILTIKLTPRITGAASLLLIGIATLNEANNIPLGDSGRNPLSIIGITFIILTVVFLFFVIFRRKIFNMRNIGDLTSKLQEVNGIVPFKNLPNTSKKILLISTAISGFLLLSITILPIQVTAILGDGATVLLTCFTIWIPFLFWVQYLGLRFRLPTFIFLGLIIIIFSGFNGNTKVTLIDQDQNIHLRDTVFEHYTNEFRYSKKPIVFILSEGGGIRAAYWSSTLLSRLDKELPKLRESIFAINGVSGGAFGSTVYLSLLKDQNGDSKNIQNMAKEIVGKDYLSPVVGTMLTRGLLQYIIPFPIQSFDHAKVFEKSWEYYWNKIAKNQDFSKNIDSLWTGDLKLPPLFINSTRVEDGFPFLISSLKLKSDIIQDIYDYIPKDKGLKISTASLLSARFPYVGPAGIINYKQDDDKITMGLVDGGYFDNTGSNTTFEILMKLYQTKKYSFKRNKPIVLYIKNGSDTKDLSSSGKTLLYQIMAPINTTMQIRDSNTKNDLKRVQELVEFLDGNFYTFSLDSQKDYNTEIPLGWALSQTTQNEIDKRVEYIINDNDSFQNLREKLK